MRGLLSVQDEWPILDGTRNLLRRGFVASFVVTLTSLSVGNLTSVMAWPSQWSTFRNLDTGNALRPRDGKPKVRMVMKPTIATYTIAMPWYEREDFARLWQLAHDRDDMPCDYEEWQRNALAVRAAWLARGRLLEIVTVRPEEFLTWLAGQGLPNTAAVRRRYVEELARHCRDVA